MLTHIRTVRTFIVITIMSSILVLAYHSVYYIERERERERERDREREREKAREIPHFIYYVVHAYAHHVQ